MQHSTVFPELRDQYHTPFVAISIAKVLLTKLMSCFDWL